MNYFPHRPGKNGPRGLLHEKSDYETVIRLKPILEPAVESEVQQSMHRADEVTTWFGVSRDANNNLILEDYGRYTAVMARTPSTHGRERFPHLVSFIGQTGAGKSTLIKMLVDFIGNPSDTSLFPSPVVSSLVNLFPTSGDVHLYADPLSYDTKQPILYADCEGLDDGEGVPLCIQVGGMDRQTRIAGLGGTKQPILYADCEGLDDGEGVPLSIQAGGMDRQTRLAGLGGGTTLHQKLKRVESTERQIVWATSSRSDVVTRLYPQLLYTFSDVIVLVVRNVRMFESVLTRLLRWALRSLQGSVNQLVLPHVIIVLNATDISIDSAQWDVTNATQMLLAGVDGALYKSNKFREYIQFWQNQGKSINSMKDLLESFFSTVTVIRIPAKPAYMRIRSQLNKLYQEISDRCKKSYYIRMSNRMLFNAVDLHTYLPYAFDHFSMNIDVPFNFIEAPLRKDLAFHEFGSNILKLAVDIKDKTGQSDIRSIFQELSQMVASCILLDIARHRLKGAAEVLLDKRYMESCNLALTHFCAYHWPCQFSNKRGSCVNSKAGHAKGHQDRRGGILAFGGYQSDFVLSTFEEEWHNMLEHQLVRQSNSVITKQQVNLSTNEERAVEDSHFELMQGFYRNLGGATKFISHVTCLCCLMERPEHSLRCGHVLCTPCVHSYSSNPKKSSMEMDKCPLHAKETAWQDHSHNTEGIQMRLVSDLRPATTTNSEAEGKQNARVEDRSHNPEDIHAGPPTDSGYASTMHNKFEHVQNTQTEDHAQISGDVQSRPPVDEGFVSIINEPYECAQNPEDQELDDNRTDYSDASSLPPLEGEGYISGLADDLFSKARSEQPDSQIMERIFGVLPELLKAFALKVGHPAPTQMHRDVMFFIHKYRSDIVGSFKDRYSHEENLADNRTRDPDKMPLEVVMSNWYQTLEDPEDSVTPDPDFGDLNEANVDDLVDRKPNEEAGEGVYEETNMPELSAYRDFIFKAPAYEWLLASLRREFLLSPAEPNSMEDIRRQIICSLPSSHKVSRKKSAEAYRMTFRVEWDPLAFVKEQEYREELDEVVEIAITLTGSAKDAQALTCAQYLCQTWPSIGRHTIRLVKEVVRGGPGHRHTCGLPDGTQLDAWIHESRFMVEAFGTGDSVAEIGQQLAWLGAALRSSPYEFGVAYCTPFISDICVSNALPPVFGPEPRSDILCKIDFTIQGREERFEPSNGQCWHNMFRNPVVIKGYPIPHRSETDTGLEIPLNVMAGKVFIKGFSTMLVPTKQSGDLLIWHLLYNKDGDRISYLDNTVPHVENISVFDLEKARHVLGWCSEVRNYAGAADANYTIDRSRLPAPHAGCVLEKVSVSGGKFITGGFIFGIGNKEKPVHVSRDGYVPKLQWISKKFVVLWDEEDKRGWLVNGTSALLHLLRASLEHNRTDKFKSAFLFKPEEMKDAPIPHTADSAIDVLLDPTNMKLEIYPEKGEMYDEEMRHNRSQLQEVSKKKKRYLRLEDRVEHFYDILEKIIDHQVDVAGQSGDLATDRDPFYPRVATLQTTGKGWVDFTRSIHAITLFGRGFGEIIQPADTSSSCAYWANLPKGRYYLAACVSDLKEIMDMDGDQKANPMKLNDDIIWYNPDKIFERCHCTEKIQGKHSGLVQVLLPSKFCNILPKKDSVELGDRSAVIFGHNLNFKWHWNDTGDPVRGEPPPPPKESETQFRDSGIGPSLGSSATEGSGDLVVSSSQQPQSDGSSVKPLLDPAASVSVRSNRDELQTASTQERGNRGLTVAQQGRQDRGTNRLLLRVFRELAGSVVQTLRKKP
ncbi:MAG: hypothetical protein M1840_008318 [Geoglossum simile]|nr:MAG: hypothetical protein M1840_008318 [Geoglossum simile]